jgi:hypothetical protein
MRKAFYAAHPLAFAANDSNENREVADEGNYNK